jgi:hypothetical protein
LVVLNQPQNPKQQLPKRLLKLQLPKLPLLKLKQPPHNLNPLNRWPPKGLNIKTPNGSSPEQKLLLLIYPQLRNAAIPTKYYG